jgi:excisionase family DNA binding protein
MERAYTIKEFSNSYKVGRTKTWQLIKEGRLKAVSVGSKKLIRADDAETWLSSLQDSGSQNAA